LPYLETVIRQSIDLDIDDCTNEELATMPPSAKDPQTDHEFHLRLSTDSNIVACKKQANSSSYNATWFKYSHKGQGKDVCRFGTPQDLLSNSKADELGVIHLPQNHVLRLLA
jgi:hypothetical protein